tara:strand:- start:17897 stop:19183 length:1287 start_codon:yes stop_codon:yes gene_type:complete
MINSFSQYLVEEDKVVYFTFGRMNPPTLGHEMLLNKLAKAAGNNPYKIFLSKSTDAKKNPLKYNDKVKFARKMFPKHAREIVKDDKIINIMDIASRLYDSGFTSIVMAVDGPRSREFDILLNKYNGKKARHGFYNFKSISFVNVGERNDSSEGIDGVSATKQRTAAVNNDFIAFTQGIPKSVSNSDSKALFNAVRKGMGLKEENTFKRHVQLPKLSETREMFVSGSLFELGEQVIIKKTDEVGTISVLGSNYIIVETADRKTRQWVDAVEKIEESTQPDWGTDASTKKAKSMTPGEMEEEGKGLWHNIHKKREEGRPMRKPGTKGAPTKQDFKDASEATDVMSRAKDVISKDKADIAKDVQNDKIKHDRILDRARRTRMLKKNGGVKVGESVEDMASHSNRHLATILTDPRHPMHAAAKAEHDRRSKK